MDAMPSVRRALSADQALGDLLLDLAGGDEAQHLPAGGSMKRNSQGFLAGGVRYCCPAIIDRALQCPPEVPGETIHACTYLLRTESTGRQ